MKLNELIGKQRIGSELIRDIQKWSELDLVDELYSIPMEVKRAGYFNILSEYLIMVRGLSKVKNIPPEKIIELADELHNLPHMLRDYPRGFKDEFFWHITDSYIRNLLLEWFVYGIFLS